MADDGPAGPPNLPLRTPIGAVADEAFDRIASLVRTVLGVPVALVSLVDRDGQVFPGQSGLPQPWRDRRCTPLTHSFCQYVVGSAEPLVVADARLDPRLKSNLAISEIGVIGYAGLPLFDLDGRAVGSLCAIDTAPHEWTAGQIALLTDLAATCSAELQLRAAAETARVEQSRTSALLELSETLSTTLTVTDVSQAVSKLAVSQLGGLFGGITLFDDERQQLTYVDLGSLPEAVRAGYQSYPVSRPTPSSTAVSTGQAFYFQNLDQMAELFPLAAESLTGSGAAAGAYLPLQVADRILGTVSLLWSAPREFDAGDRALLVGLSGYTAQAVQRALLLADRREVAETLQAAMLPRLPQVAWAELTGRYLPARIADAVGGDWYDAFLLPDGSLALSVGDVEGHDTGAAAVMGQLRSSLRSLSVVLPGPVSDVLGALDDVLTWLPSDRHATAIVAALTRHEAGGTLAWVNAGHPPALVLSPGQPARFLPGRPQPLLGLRVGAVERRTHTAELPPGSTVLLYTDGLVERRDTDLDDSLAELAASAERHRDRELPDLVDAVLVDLVHGSHEDDVVLLGVRIPPAAPDAALPQPG